MSVEQTVIIGSRGSRLAVRQAQIVQDRLKGTFPDVQFILKKITTTGDRDPESPLDSIGGQGIFVKELEQALLKNRIDVAVHSLKDMPTELTPGLIIAAVPEREDPRDVLVTFSGKGLAELPAGSRVGTGSARRAIELLWLRPDLEIIPLRGNVDTRLKKVASGQLDGAIMAAAALCRMGCQEHITEYLPLAHFVPAAGQGALCIETRANDHPILHFVAQMNHFPTMVATMAERAFLEELGGGCRAPIAALGTLSGEILELNGIVAGVNSHKLIHGYEKGPAGFPDRLAKRLARSMIKEGAAGLIAEAGR